MRNETLSKKLILGLILLFSFQASSEVLTTSLAHCKKTSGPTDIYELDQINYNRVSVLNDKDTGITFKCPVELRSDKAITRIQVDVATDTAASVTNLTPDDNNFRYYFPQCSMWISYNPGGSDLVNLVAEKSVSWGNYTQLAIDNPTLQHPGSGYANTAVLTCNTAYYSDETRFYGLRITYAD